MNTKQSLNDITPCHTVVKNSNDDEEDVKPGEYYQQQVETVPHVLRKVVAIVIVRKAIVRKFKFR